jgi:hypothetical protein
MNHLMMVTARRSREWLTTDAHGQYLVSVAYVPSAWVLKCGCHARVPCDHFLLVAEQQGLFARSGWSSGRGAVRAGSDPTAPILNC